MWVRHVGGVHCTHVKKYSEAISNLDMTKQRFRRTELITQSQLGRNTGLFIGELHFVTEILDCLNMTNPQDSVLDWFIGCETSLCQISEF